MNVDDQNDRRSAIQAQRGLRHSSITTPDAAARYPGRASRERRKELPMLSKTCLALIMAGSASVLSAAPELRAQTPQPQGCAMCIDIIN